MEQRLRQRAESLGAFKIRAAVVHLAWIGVFFVPLTVELLIAAAIGYFIRVFSWEVGSHRYFSHRSFKTSRAFQFFLAVLAAASGQRGVLWWAEHHRRHHRHSDQHPDDRHSPVLHSFWQAHFGWLLDQDTLDTDLDAVRDLSRYPELVWINKYHYFFPLALLALTYWVGEYTTLFGGVGIGAAAVVWVFFVSMLLSQQAAFAVNTLLHGARPGWFNSRSYATPDKTSNMWLLAIPTLGAAWHNNHHRYMNSARTGFRWYEIDPSYLILRLLEMIGVVWDLNPVPDDVLAEGQATVHA